MNMEETQLIKTELTFLERTKVIIGAMNEKLFNQGDMRLFEILCAETVKSGFHDLYLKCECYDVLLNKVNNKIFLKLSMKDKILVQLLFSPAFEVNLLEKFKQTNLTALLFYLYPKAEKTRKYADAEISELLKKFLLDESQLPFEKLKNSIAKYRSWYDENAASLYKSLNNPSIIAADENANVYLDKLVQDNDYDIQIGKYSAMELKNREFLGTMELTTSIVILTIGRTYASWRHISSLGENCIKEDYEFCIKKGYGVSFYLIGGQAFDLCGYLDLISSKQYPIEDVFLLSTTKSAIDAVCFYDEKKITVGYRLRDSKTKVCEKEGSSIKQDEGFDTLLKLENCYKHNLFSQEKRKLSPASSPQKEGPPFKKARIAAANESKENRHPRTVAVHHARTNLSGPFMQPLFQDTDKTGDINLCKFTQYRNSNK
jgi:hypothetical protein